MKHEFTKKIIEILENDFPNKGQQIFEKSELLQYINHKTKSVNRSSKSRSSFANLYAIYVLIEDYINKGFTQKANYEKYEGAKFSDLIKRQRELPFGAKLQNHALNHRMNQEFLKLFPTCNYIPIIRTTDTKRYWININLITIGINNKKYKIAIAILETISAYIKAKMENFDNFIATCSKLKNIKEQTNNTSEIKDFILSLLEPTVDARLFEIVSYSILKLYFNDKTIFWGLTKDTITEENLKLYKTGRTNANDGGIDFVMKPLGRFFQVTETTDLKKYFLDIDKLEKFPITFVIKSKESIDSLYNKIQKGAKQQYSIDIIVEKYISCIEEIINLDKLIEYLEIIIAQNSADKLLNEIIKHSKIEFNYE